MCTPGFDFLKTWQGIVEMVLRVTCIVLSIIIMICASVVASAIDDVEEDLEEVSDIHEYKNAGDYRSAAGWMIFIAIMSIIIETLIIIIHILNISIINNNCITFGIIDIIANIVFVLCLFAGAVSNAAYSSDNADEYDKYNCDSNNIDDDKENACSDLETVRDAQGATAAFGFFALASFGILAGFMVYIVFMNKSKSTNILSNGEEYAEPI